MSKIFTPHHNAPFVRTRVHEKARSETPKRLTNKVVGAGFIFLIFLMFFLLDAGYANAIVDPKSAPNNKFGVHILFTSELSDAAKLVNSNGGDWGYVTIPIQAGDKDLDKWQSFMDEALDKHVIPLVRLASENYYFDTKVWKKPTEEDVLDFANFLNSLDWPTKNRYVIIFNEVNRGDEWEGTPNPSEYAKLLSYAIKIFKSLNPDFFVISAGLDNAAPNITQEFIDQYSFMIKMDEAVPGIFDQIDGLGSHSYPNPGFVQPPEVNTTKSIYSFRYEKNLAEKLGGKTLPVFITETGWARDKLTDAKIAKYFETAFGKVWTDENIIAVTPFLLEAGEPFTKFSLRNSQIYEKLINFPKIKGEPAQSSPVNASQSSNKPPATIKTFPEKKQYEILIEEQIMPAKQLLKLFLNLKF